MAPHDRQGRGIARSYNVDATTIGRLRSCASLYVFDQMRSEAITIKPQWQDAGDARFTWVARNDEENGPDRYFGGGTGLHACLADADRPHRHDRGNGVDAGDWASPAAAVCSSEARLLIQINGWRVPIAFRHNACRAPVSQCVDREPAAPLHPGTSSPSGGFSWHRCRARRKN